MLFMVIYNATRVFQSTTLQPYLEAVRKTLEAALCLQQFGSQVVERHNKPEVGEDILLPRTHHETHRWKSERARSC